MLLRVEEGGALAIGQLSHAWLSGQLARLWGNDRFAAPEPREEVSLGAEQHDIGWALFDLEPRLSAATGLPRNFLETTVEQHLSIWRGAPEHLLSQSEHAALVVSMHGASLSQLRLAGTEDEADRAALGAHVAAEHERQEALRARLGLSEQETKVTQRQMWTWDGLSLALCNGWRPFVAREVPARDGLVEIELRAGPEGAIVLDPWPFAAPAVELRCEARRLAARYEDEREMQAAFAAARPETIRFSLVRAAGSS
jgi:hypothetical protein